MNKAKIHSADGHFIRNTVLMLNDNEGHDHDVVTDVRERYVESRFGFILESAVEFAEKSLSFTRCRELSLTLKKTH